MGQQQSSSSVVDSEMEDEDRSAKFRRLAYTRASFADLVLDSSSEHSYGGAAILHCPELPPDDTRDPPNYRMLHPPDISSSNSCFLPSSLFSSPTLSTSQRSLAPPLSPQLRQRVHESASVSSSSSVPEDLLSTDEDLHIEQGKEEDQEELATLMAAFGYAATIDPFQLHRKRPRMLFEPAYDPSQTMLEPLPTAKRGRYDNLASYPRTF